MIPGDILSARLGTDAVLAVLLEGSLLLGATWVLAALLRRRSPSARHTVWTAGFVLVIVVPLLGTLLPVRSLGVLHYPRTPTTASVSAQSGAAGLEAAAPFPGLPDPAPTPLLEDGWSPVSGLGGIPTLEEMGAGLATGFLALWSLGTLILLARIVRHRVQVVRLTERGSPVPPGHRPARAVRREAARMGIRRRVRVVYTAELGVPVTWGVLRPVLLLPPDAASWSEDRLRAVTVHELAHVRRWDALSQQLAELARALYWANPLVWIGRRLAARERETACDVEVLRSGMASSDYAAVLVEMARRGTESPPGLRPEIEGGLALAAPSRLGARVSAILGDEPPQHRREGGATLASLIVLALVATPLASLSLVAERPERPGDEHALSDRILTVRALGLECTEVSLWTLARTVQEDPTPVVRKAATRALGIHDDPRTVQVLAHAAADPRQDPAVRRAAVRALGGKDSHHAAGVLVERLGDPDASVRRSAAAAMGRMERQRHMLTGPLTQTMLRDPDPAVRAAAVSALAGAGCHHAARRLRKALKDPSPAVARTAREALEGLRGR